MGKQLDSLADMVTFGLVPGVVMFVLLKNAVSNHFNQLYPDGDFPEMTATMVEYLPYLAFMMTIFSALRLAKFNIDTRQSDSFIGVPTPANAILICSIPLVLRQYTQSLTIEDSMASVVVWNLINFNFMFLIIVIVLMSFLLVAEIPLFALKFKNFSWRSNKLRFSFLITSVVLLIVFQYVAIPFIIFLYIVLSILNNKYTKSKTQS